ncbi:MAG: hypothetical protein AVO35_06385 [Candidatus Aegiribacteria sp. MLS_C]|nr:MAG: hypothetical protein AVO35_06385 [Candidatus Aegiribacteria sp. MLS_C]
MNSDAPALHSSLMELRDLSSGVFLRRKNRFVGIVEIGGERSEIHVADPGRLRELLYPGNRVLVMAAGEASTRRTRWSLVAGRGDKGWVLLNTTLHRKLAESILARPGISPFAQLRGWKAEVSPSGISSRFDFLLDPDGPEPVWLEVKGCTLKSGDRALFPDAPTTRGTRHLRDLAGLSREGSRCAVVFLVFPPGVGCFAPNSAMDPDFASAFADALDAGVDFHFLRLDFDGERVLYEGALPLCPEYEGPYSSKDE